jgi:hypothetical protein
MRHVRTTRRRGKDHQEVSRSVRGGQVADRHIFRFQIHELPDVVFTESLVGAVYFDERDDVSAYLEALDRMCAQAAPALSTEAILSCIHRWI